MSSSGLGFLTLYEVDAGSNPVVRSKFWVAVLVLSLCGQVERLRASNAVIGSSNLSRGANFKAVSPSG